MYIPGKPRVSNQIGFGDAQVYGSTAQDFTDLGKGVRRNSKGEVMRRKKESGQKTISDIDYDYTGYTPRQIDAAESERQKIVEFARDPSNIEKDTYEQDLEDLANEYKTNLMLHANIANALKLKNNEIKGKDPYDFDQESYNQYSSLYDKNYKSDLSFKDLAPDMLATINGLQQQFEVDWKEGIKPYATQSSKDTNLVGSDLETNEIIDFTEESASQVEQDFIDLFMAGFNTFNGTAQARSRAGEAFFEEAYNDAMEQNPTKVASFGNDKEGLFNYIKGVARDKYMSQARIKSKVRRNQSSKPAPVTEQKRGASLDIARDFKEKVNNFQDSGDPTEINEYLNSRNLKVEFKDDNKEEFVIMERKNIGGAKDIDENGQRPSAWDQVSGVLRMDNAEDIYAALAENISDLKLSDINSVDFDDPNKGAVTTRGELEFKDKINAMFSGNDYNDMSPADIANELGVEYTPSTWFTSRKIKVGDKTYDLSDAKQAREAYEAVEGKGKKISPEEFNQKWSKLKSGESLVGPDGKTYTKQ